MIGGAEPPSFTIRAATSFADCLKYLAFGVANGNHERAPFGKLFPQRRWALGGRGRDDDPIVRSVVRPAERSVADH